MVFCTKCGAPNDGEVKFCTACDERLEASTARPSAATPFATALTGLATGEKVIICGAAVAALSFFPPWASGRSPLTGRSESITGVELASQATGWAVTELLTAVVVAALVFLSRQGSQRVRIQVAGWQILLGTIFAFLGLAGLFVGDQLTGVLGSRGAPGPSVGWWGFSLGYVTVIVDSFVTLNELSTGP